MAHLYQVKWIETDLGVRCLLAEGLGKGWTEIHGGCLDLGNPFFTQVIEEFI